LIEYGTSAGVARITLNRPDKRNAITSEMMTALREALGRAREDSTVRVLLIRGAGKDFCAGLDLGEVLKSAENAEGSLASARRLGDLYIAMRRHPKPIISAVQGRALGGRHRAGARAQNRSRAPLGPGSVCLVEGGTARLFAAQLAQSKESRSEPR